MSSFVLGLQSYRKTREKANFFTHFLFFIGVQASKLGVFALFRMQVTSPKEYSLTISPVLTSNLAHICR